MKSPVNTLEELGRKQVDLFHLNNQIYIDCLVKFNSPRHILTLCYNKFVRLKKIIPIEQLPEEEKNKLWGQTKWYCDGRMTKDGVIELAKALYILEYLL